MTTSWLRLLRAEQGTLRAADMGLGPNPGNVPCCMEVGPEGYSCTRERGHPGRHIACGTVLIFEAWPGDHEPCEADLKEGTR